MLTENDVVQAVAGHLATEGYRIDKALSTIERGVDIVAVHLATGYHPCYCGKVGKEARGRNASLPTSCYHQEQIGVAIVVVVDPGNATGEGFDNVAFLPVSRSQYESDSGLPRYLDEMRESRLRAFRSLTYFPLC